MFIELLNASLFSAYFAKFTGDVLLKKYMLKIQEIVDIW